MKCIIVILAIGILSVNKPVQAFNHKPENGIHKTAPICADSLQLVTYIWHGLQERLLDLSKHNSKEFYCSFTESYAQKTLALLGENCTRNQIFKAISSSHGTAVFSTEFPDLDSNYCLRHKGYQRSKRNAVAIQAWLWKDNKIPYVIDKTDFGTAAVVLIIQAISQFNKDVSCIQFTPRTNEFDYVRFKSGTGCHSSIGRDGGEQTITIGQDCYYLGVIMHEMTHAVGFFHEQNRWDRDQYITIHWNNILAGKEHDFVVQDKNYLTTLGAPYDYGSIMHYGQDIFSKDGSSPTITPKYDPHGEMGQRDGFSPLDIWKINKLYGCNPGPPPTPHWMTFLSSTHAPTGSTPTTTPPTTPTTKTTTGPISQTTVRPGIPGKPTVLVTVFPNALRINWNRPPSTDPITAYVITYKLEPNGQRHQIHVSPNKLGYYLSTYTTHPGRRYTITVAAVSQSARGPDSDPKTVRSACSHAIALDNDSYDKIHSPFFKNGYYEQDVICEWKLKAPDGQRINLTFHQLQIDGHNGCDADFVRVGDTRLYCNVPPGNGSLLTASNDVTVTFMSKPGSSERKSGGFNMSAAAEGFSPMNVLVEQLQTAFNITWDPPVATPSSPTSYVIHYKLTSVKQEHEVVLPASRRHFILSTWPHYGREYEVGVSANFPTLKGSSSGPFIQRSKCSRNITVSGPGQHLGSPHYPQTYEPGTICTWNVDAISGHSLVLSFEHIDLRSGVYISIESMGNKLIMDSSYTSSLPIGVDRATVQFVSDEHEEGSGFRLNINLV